ncbi:hypothetical protein QR680_006484 [Steinernema hermaphroditum]|nr:hypothetical protein QR680_006484 [Steinernema hermaphroditum]
MGAIEKVEEAINFLKHAKQKAEVWKGEVDASLMEMEKRVSDIGLEIRSLEHDIGYDAYEYLFKWFFLALAAIIMALVTTLVYNCRILGQYSSDDEPQISEAIPLNHRGPCQPTLVLQRASPQPATVPVNHNLPSNPH